MIRPKKSLGQHFLYDKNILGKIVHVFQPADDDAVVEIGAGTGALTEYLIGKCRRLTVVEKDKRAVDTLCDRYADVPGLSILHLDFLEVSLRELTEEDDRRLRIIGNIPYYITSPILFHLIDQRQYISDVIILVQHEAADRIIAGPDSPGYGILSVLTQTWADTEVIFKVPPTVFYPRPSVVSALLRLRFRDPVKVIYDESLFQTIVRGTFGKRRKMLRRSLKYLFPDRDIAEMPGVIDLNKRPEQLTVTEFIMLSNTLYGVIDQH